jgi:DNA-binding NtrC family response regulator
MGPRLKNILIVDDDRTQLIIASKYLSSPDRNIVAVRSGREALRHLQNQKCQLVICDYQMPDLDGLEFLRGMKKLEIKCPAILVTGTDELSVVNSAYRLGVSTFMSKPVNWKALCSQVALLLT